VDNTGQGTRLPVFSNLSKFYVRPYRASSNTPAEYPDSVPDQFLNFSTARRSHRHQSPAPWIPPAAHTPRPLLQLAPRPGTRPEREQLPDRHPRRIGTRRQPPRSSHRRRPRRLQLHYPAERLDIHKTYKLTVVGTPPNGLTSSTGVFLDGANNGKSGSNYQVLITRFTLAGPVSHVATQAAARTRTTLLNARAAAAHPHGPATARLAAAPTLVPCWSHWKSAGCSRRLS
jgi:hypothetical protein